MPHTVRVLLPMETRTELPALALPQLGTTAGVCIAGQQIQTSAPSLSLRCLYFSDKYINFKNWSKKGIKNKFILVPNILKLYVMFP